MVRHFHHDRVFGHVEQATMSFLMSGPALFVDDDELAACIEMFSARVRLDAVLRPAMDLLVGNRWADAEKQAHRLFHASLFRDAAPNVDANWLARAVRVLQPGEVDRTVDILISCILETFPLDSAGEICEIATELANTLKAIIATDGLERQRRLLHTHIRLNAGALLSSF
jgi:hypothetical protein